jgi:hypothetical protein
LKSQSGSEVLRSQAGPYGSKKQKQKTTEFFRFFFPRISEHVVVKNRKKKNRKNLHHFFVGKKNEKRGIVFCCKKTTWTRLTGLLQMNSTNRAYEKAINCQLSTTRTYECMRHDDIDFWQKPQESNDASTAKNQQIFSDEATH